MLCGLLAANGETEHIIAGTAGYILGYILSFALRKKEALGFGDVKLLAVAGVWLGIDGLSLASIYACVLGVIWGIAKKQKFVPFAPFLFMGAGIYYLTMDLTRGLLWRI